MPAGISALAPAAEQPRDLDVRLGKAAFAVLRKNAGVTTSTSTTTTRHDTTLPLLHNPAEMAPDSPEPCKNQANENGKKEAEEDENDDEEEDDDDDSSNASKLTMIRRLSKSSDQLARGQRAPGLSRCSRSQGNLNKTSDCCSLRTVAGVGAHMTTEEFGEALNAKLRRVQEQEQEEQRRQAAAARLGHARHARPFITTVKSGEFLMPPPEVAALLGIGQPVGQTCSPASVDDCHHHHQHHHHHHHENNHQLDAHCRSRFRQQLVSLGRRPEVRHQAHNARCQGALRANVLQDFITGSWPKRENCSRLASSSLTPRAFPKKLEPIGGPMTKLPSPWDHPPSFGTLMFDRRIMPGSSFSATQNIFDCERSQAAKQAEVQKRHVARKRAQIQSSLIRLGTPPPVPGRKHEPVQTELYLEELFDKPDESEVAVQTDYFLDRPATPPYCPPKRGQDACTQIEPGDLFDYDVEVQPILEVLVGKTIQQAMLEVLEEEEIAMVREQQRKFNEIRAIEKAEQQRLEEQDRRIREEKDRRMKQHEEAIKAQLETEERVAATVLLTGYIAELLPAVLENLKISGFLLDEIKTDVEEEFTLWLTKEVKKEMSSIVDSRKVLEDILKEIIENRAKTYKRLGEESDSRKAKSEFFEDVCEGDEFVDELSMSGNLNDIDYKHVK